jgi:hypothetical protein
VDINALLTVLVAVSVIDSVAICALLLLAVGDRQGSAQARAARHDAGRGVGRPASVRPPTDAGSAGAPTAEASPDPLAGAISAFLARPEGIFRARESAPGPSAGPPVSGPGMPPAGGPAMPAVPVATAGPGATGILERSGREVTWSPSRPSRYVPSGPRPGGPAGGGDASPTGEPAAAGRSPETGGPSLSPVEAVPEMPPDVAPPSRPASRLEVRLVDRGGGSAPAEAAVAARLGPVIRGLLRERTRARDSVATEGPGRFVVILPGTSTGGAAAVARRLADGCDGWLAAETPPLRLDLAAAAVPGGVPAGDPDPIRGSGPERRRTPAVDG